MGFYSWTRWGCHGLDTSAYDNADDNVDKYTKLLKAMDNQLEKYASNKELADSYFKNANETLQSNNAGTQGHWLTFYNEKVGQWKSHKFVYYCRMTEEYELAQERRTTVSNLVTEWEDTRTTEANNLDAARQRQIEEEERRLKEFLGISS